MSAISIPGLQFRVWKESLQQSIEEYGLEPTARSLLTTGGFAAIELRVGAREAVLAAYGPDHPSLAVLNELREGERVITVTDAIADLLLPEELAAILFHEEGHLVLGDAEAAKAYMAANQAAIEAGEVSPFLHEPWREIRADAYAAERVGCEAAASALRRSTRLSLETAGRLLGKTPEEIEEAYQQVITGDEYVERLAALKAA